METLTAHEARNSFGDTLIKAQHSPVRITKNGRPIAVLVSMENYRVTEEMKMQFLRGRVSNAEVEIANGEFVDGEAFMRELSAGKYD